MIDQLPYSSFSTALYDAAQKGVVYGRLDPWSIMLYREPNTLPDSCRRAILINWDTCHIDDKLQTVQAPLAPNLYPISVRD